MRLTIPVLLGLALAAYVAWRYRAKIGLGS
jgi:hypothetical protein